MGNGRAFKKGPGMQPDQFGLIQRKKRKRASRRQIPKLQSHFAEMIEAAKKATGGMTAIADAAKSIQAVQAEGPADNSEVTEDE